MAIYSFSHSSNPFWKAIGYSADYVTSNLEHTHDFNLRFSAPNFEIAISQEWEGWLARNEKDASRLDGDFSILLNYNYEAVIGTPGVTLDNQKYH